MLVVENTIAISKNEKKKENENWSVDTALKRITQNSVLIIWKLPAFIFYF